MTKFIAIYAGPSIAEAELVAVSSAPHLVDEVYARLVKDDKKLSEEKE